MKRVVTPELLDSDCGTQAEIALALVDLGRINRWFGGVATSEQLVRRVVRAIGRRDLSLLDVAAGSGEFAHDLSHQLRNDGIALEVTLLDRSRAHLNGAPNSFVGDALAMPFPDAAFDVAHCSLFVHHLEPPQVVQFVNEALRVCSVALLINDLRRTRLHLAAVHAWWPMFRSRMAYLDGVASVRRAYTESELRDLLQQTRAARFEIKRHALYRMGAVAWK